MTIELHGFGEIIHPSQNVIAAPRSFARMQERLGIQDKLDELHAQAGNAENFDELNRRGNIATISRRLEELKVTPGQPVQYLVDETDEPSTANRH